MKTLVVFLLPAFLLLSACSQSVSTTAPAPLSGTRGGYQGRIMQHDVDSYSYGMLQAGALFLVDGTVYATTNDSGYYSAFNIPYGLHNLSFTKAGFDTAFVLGDRLDGDTSILPDMHIQIIPMDSLVCDSVHFWQDSTIFDSTTRTFDTRYYPEIFAKLFGPDSLSRASVIVTRIHANGASAVIGDELAWVESLGDLHRQKIIVFGIVPFLSDPKTSLHKGDRLQFTIRAACAPTANLPITYSPFVTSKEVVVQ